MLEALLAGNQIASYDFNSASGVLLHLDGTDGQAAGSGSASIVTPDVHGHPSAGIYSSAKYVAAGRAYGTTGVDCSPASTSVIFINANKVGDFVHANDFTVEVYLSKKNASLSKLNPIFCDRYSPDLTTSFPSYGYPPSGTYTSSILMSCYVFVAANGNLGLSLKGLTGSGSTWYNTTLDTGVNLWNLLSTTQSRLFLIQMKSKQFQVYVDGKLIYSVANPAWAGPGYNTQLDFGNNWTLSSQAMDLIFDEVRYTNGLARVVGGSYFIPPTTAFVN